MEKEGENIIMTVYLSLQLQVRKTYLKVIEYFYWQH